MNTTISEKGQITIPKEIRDKLGLVPGTHLHFEADHGRLVATKEIQVDVFTKWRGKGKLPGNMSVDKYLKIARGC